MIQIGDTSYAFSDPRILAAAGAVLLVLAILALLVAAVRASARAARSVEPLARDLGHVAARVQLLSDGQERLAGGLHHVSEAQAKSQTAMLELMEKRLAEVQGKMGETLTGTATRTARSLGELQGHVRSQPEVVAPLRPLPGL